MKLLTEKEEDDLTEVPSPKALNKLISRSEEEYALFQKIDKEDPPPQLLQEHELPDWLLTSYKSKDDDDDIIYGRGMRQRGEINYNIDASLKIDVSFYVAMKWFFFF